MSNPQRNSGSILAGLRTDITEQMKTQPEASPEASTGRRRQSDFWINIGVIVPGMGKPDPDGNPTDQFVSLPTGLALDDMRHEAIKGTSENWIALAQAKNGLLDRLREAAAKLAPGERIDVPVLTVQLYRKAEPQQVGDASSNPLIKGLFEVLEGGKQD